jgi:hypothetical protein
MVGRRTVAGISLFCAVGLFAFAAPSAFAAKGTTVFRCESVFFGAQFEDVHCDNTKEGFSGFAHKEISPGSATELESNNEKTATSTTASTPAILEAEALGIKISIECKKSSAKGSVTNESGPPMKASGTGVVKYTECKELLQGCKVTEPIEFEFKGFTKVIKESAPEEMGVEFTPLSGTAWSPITLSNCANPLVNGTFELTGTVIGTLGGTPNGKGATLTFTKGMTEKTLKFFGNPAKFSSIETVKMKGSTETVTLTTTAT